MSTPTCARPRGFSLIEAMVAGAIVIIVLTSAASSLAMGFRFIAERKARMVAQMVAQSHMEMLLAIETERNLNPPYDCQPVRYNREIIGEEAAPFFARCSILRDTPRSEGRYNRLVVEVEVVVDRRTLRNSFSTYLEHR
jgi:hypothetical protein